MGEEFVPLSIQKYSSQAQSTDRTGDTGSLRLPILGLFGETGSLLSEVKKKQRDRASYLGYADAVVEELGDALWYLNLVASRGGLALADVAENLNAAGAAWHKSDGTPILFSSLQPRTMPLPREPTAEFEKTLLRLAGQVGRLVTDHEAGLCGDALGSRLSEILQTLIHASDEAGVTLEGAALKNLHKIFDRWPRERCYPPLLDQNSDPEEQLPRDLHVDLLERKVCGRTYVFQRCNGINLGDRLTDNVMAEDDYRYHDVFHYAYVAVLGWSPVTRSLLRLKRKSNPKIDEAEDGARAILIEEGFTTWLFSQAMDLEFFANVQRGDLPLGLLKHVRQFVSGYEPEQCPLWLWEEAILQGYEAFRFLREHRRGRVHIDAANRRLNVRSLP